MKIRKVVARDERDDVVGRLVGAPVLDDELADRLVIAWAKARGYKAIELRTPPAGIQYGEITYLPGPHVTASLHEVYEHARIAAARDDVRRH